MNRDVTHPFWQDGDREGFIEFHIRNAKTSAGLPVTRQIASRWFNLMTIVSQTEDDIWIHREKDQLWWTRSKLDTPIVEQGLDPTLVGDQRVVVCFKPCNEWASMNAKGSRLDWTSLHPRAKEFLFTEGTLQKLGYDNAEYARALVAGADLTPWHSQATWKKKLAEARTAPVTNFNAVRRAAVRMAMQAFSTASRSNGQEVTRIVRNKEVRFTQPELEDYLVALMEAQDGLCALTELPFQLDGQYEDVELLPSLDRIDSDGHNEAGNLQVVCRFANRWKNDDKDDNFRRLIGVVRGL